MPYNVQHRGSSYVVVDDSGKVVGTHETKQEAINHQRALYANVPDASKNMNLYSMLTPVEKAYHDALVGVVAQHGYFDQGSQSVWVGYEGAAENEKASIGVVCSNCSFYKQDGGCQIVSFKVEAGGYCRLAAIPDNLIVESKEEDEMEDVEKKAPCWEGYVMRGMKPSKDGSGRMVPNCVPATSKAYEGCGCEECLKEDITCSDCDFCAGDMSKAEDTYAPNAGMKAAARRALKWKEEGKATGAGTAVGWGRASDIVAGRSMSLSTVKRMYSFFSRHEVDKKGKDFYNTSNPSNGRIMWDAWGGDAGFSWSRKIVEREQANKVWQGSLFTLR